MGWHRIQTSASGMVRWGQANLSGFGDLDNWMIQRMSVFGGYLYAGTETEDTGGEVWRTPNGTDWSQVNVSFAGTLYAAVNNYGTGAEVWRSATGDLGSWTQCNVDGFGDIKNTGLWAVTVFDGYLYAAPTQWRAWNQGTHTGVEVWRTHDGAIWSQVNADGFWGPR